MCSAEEISYKDGNQARYFKMVFWLLTFARKVERALYNKFLDLVKKWFADKLAEPEPEEREGVSGKVWEKYRNAKGNNE